MAQVGTGTCDQVKIVAAGDDDVVDGAAPVHLLDLSCRTAPSCLNPNPQVAIIR